tara:strand:- start:971 stop:1345 length:375 start_codon:yes stop_codon:yes gene_type:complete
MKKITARERILLQTLSKAFQKKLVKNYEGEALKAFNRNATVKDVVMLSTLKAISKIPSLSDNGATKWDMRFLDATVPLLTKTFGEAALVKAMPLRASENDVIELCHQLGAKRIADICKKRQASR